MTNELHEVLERFNALPDDAILPSRVTGIILGVSERTVRYHPNLPRVQISRGRYGQRVGDIRKLCREVCQRGRWRDVTNKTITGMYEVFDALESALQSADPIKRQELANVLDAYHDDFPEDFHWAIGASSPTLLSNLLMTMDAACRSSEQSKSRNVVVRLIDRKPEGSA